MADVRDTITQVTIDVEQIENYENLETYTLVGGGYLERWETRVAFNALPQKTTSDVYLQSPNIIFNDFELHYHIHITDLQDYPGPQPTANQWGGYVTTLFARDVTHTNYQKVELNGLSSCPAPAIYGNGLGCGIRSLWAAANTQPTHIFAIYNWDNALCPGIPPTGEYSDFVFWKDEPNTGPGSAGQPPLDIYVKMIKTGNMLTYWLYSDASMTQLLLNYQGVPFPGSGITISNINTAPYQYFLPVATRGATNTTYTITGYAEYFIFY